MHAWTPDARTVIPHVRWLEAIRLRSRDAEGTYPADHQQNDEALYVRGAYSMAAKRL